MDKASRYRSPHLHLQHPGNFEISSQLGKIIEKSSHTNGSAFFPGIICVQIAVHFMSKLLSNDSNIEINKYKLSHSLGFEGIA